MQFVAIDFETASFKRDSACQLAVVVVEESKIVEERCWLIRPPQMFFSERCIAVHGIRPRDCMDQPEWEALWPEIAPLIDGRVLMAHCAGFDLGVLVSTMATYSLACPDFEYACTRLIARRTWPGRDGYGLKPTADALGLTFRHHDALEDARVCAHIALAAGQQSNAQSLEELEQQLSITRGKIRFGVLTNPRCLRRSRSPQSQEPAERGPRSFAANGFPRTKKASQQALLNLQTLIHQCQGSRPLEGRHIVLQGSLLGVERQEAIGFLMHLGAQIQDRINLQTDFLVVGQACPETKDAESNCMASPREQVVSQRQDQGQPIRILSQRQLLALIPGGMAAARAIASGS